MDGHQGRFSLVSFRLQGKVDHHDRILFDNADKQDNADDSDNSQFHIQQEQRQKRPHPGGREG